MELNEVHTEHEHATTSLKVLLLVFAIVLVGALSYLVWAQNTASDATDYSAAVTKKTTTETATPSTSTTTPSVTSTDETATDQTIVSTKDGKVSFRLPKGWRVVGDVNYGEKQCGKFTGKCLLSVSFEYAPKGPSGNTSIAWQAQVFETSESVKKWSENTVGLYDKNFFVEENETPVNGYNTYFVKFVSDTKSYTDLNYHIGNNGLIIWFWEREKSTVNDESWDYTTFSPEFVKIVKTVKLAN
ncbi:MAG: hypothetical protein Q8Q05_02240 [bacterium]|nr:hypothetical protein [bacterium]